MKSVYSKFLCLAALIVTASVAFSSEGQVPEEGKMPEVCALKDRSYALALVICNPEAGESVWREAGRAACATGNDAVCNAWIWDSNDKAPSAAPVTDTDLGERFTSVAVAVWVNDSQSLISLRRVQ